MVSKRRLSIGIRTANYMSVPPFARIWVASSIGILRRKHGTVHAMVPASIPLEKYSMVPRIPGWDLWNTSRRAELFIGSKERQYGIAQSGRGWARPHVTMLASSDACPLQQLSLACGFIGRLFKYARVPG